MRNLKLHKPIIMLATVSIVLVTSSHNSNVYNSEYTINPEYTLSDTILPFATCSAGDVYICNRNDADRMELEEENNFVLVIDEREKQDPNIRIQDSASINDTNQMAAVLEVVQKYNELYPSKWNRSTDAMMNEWKIHNICSDLSVMPSHTKDVDLNNKDEYLYKSKILTKILQN